MTKRALAILLGLIILLAATLAWAGPYDRQIADQQRSIDRGIASGKLTHHEADIVQDNLNHVRQQLDRSRQNDGRLDRREREKIERMLQRNDRMIRKMKNNSIQRVY
jgi:TolA-binding protein